VGRIYPWEGLSTRDQDGDYLANYHPSQGYSVDGYAFTAPVDAIPQNGWNLYNMAGNVAEWTRDAYTPSYDNLSDFNPLHEDGDEPRHVVRGGAWNSNASFIGVGMRDTQPKEEASADVGFRCVREVTIQHQEKVATDSRGARNTGQE
jgi:formylglycine-generating enzyme required for sulfatase activity